MKGKFIVIDGIRGSGKSTIINYLKEIYNEGNVVFTREPGGSELAEKIREVMLCEEARQADGGTQFCLIWASRADHLKNTIVPALTSGKHVISDRFDSSTYGLQIYAQEGFHLKDLYWKVRSIFVGDFTPDLYLFLDVEPEERKRRFLERKNNNSHFHDREPAYYERMKEGYMDFLSQVPHVIIDANQDVESVKKDCLEAIKKYF